MEIVVEDIRCVFWPIPGAAEIIGVTYDVLWTVPPPPIELPLRCASISPSTAGGFFQPGRMYRDCFPTSKGPCLGVKRAIRLISFCSPPTLSQGSQMLYEWPRSDLP